MATFTKVHSFTEAMAEKVHNLASDQLKIALTNTAPTTSNTVYADIVSPVASTNLSGANPFNITTTSSGQTSGVYKLILADLVLTATGSVGPFRYIVIYNSTAASQQLLGYIDYGSSVTMTTGQTFTIDFDVSNGLFTN